MMIEPIMQGDAYGIPINVKFDGQQLTESNVDTIEILIGDNRKTNGNGVEWDEDSGAWAFMLSQEETFAMPVGQISFQVRIKMKNSDDVIGTKLPPISVISSKSKVVL